MRDRESVKAAAKAIYGEGAYCGECDYAGWESCPDCRDCCESYAIAALTVYAPFLAEPTGPQPQTDWPDVPRLP